ncbi:MAG: SDR family NAD(P)-dependent oxidoreductase [Planctomycetota bacterium]
MSPTPNPRSLEGRHALVTGGSRGIGAAVADRLGAMGATVSLVGRDAEALAARCAEVREAHGVASDFAALDVSDRAALKAGIQKLVDAHGHMDVLVNNVGGSGSAPFLKTSDDDWDRAIALNLDSAFLTTQIALPGMLEQKFGRVVMVASTAAQRGYGYVAPYVAAKHGVLGLVRALAVEFAKSGVTFNAVCPGFVDTDMTKESVHNIAEKTGRSEDEARKQLEKLNPQGRLVTPDEVASAVAFLCDPEQSSMNGNALSVSGGEVMN